MSVVSDNGTELTSMAILCGSPERDADWRHIAPGEFAETVNMGKQAAQAH